MMKFLCKKLFKRKEAGFNFLEIDSSELDQYSTGITDILEQKLDGFLIRNVINADEAERIAKKLEDMSTNNKLLIEDQVLSYPIQFSSVEQLYSHSDELLKKHFSDVLTIREKFKDISGVNLIEIITNTLNKLSGNRQVKVAENIVHGGIYNPCTIRCLPDGGGHLKVHCGNSFHDSFPIFYEALDKISNIKNQMSFFIMLRPAEIGGELVLYNVRWNQAKKKWANPT